MLKRSGCLEKFLRISLNLIRYLLKDPEVKNESISESPVNDSASNAGSDVEDGVGGGPIRCGKGGNSVDFGTEGAVRERDSIDLLNF